jgi:colanic acid biosynthesis glycosyl transferase WcaI
VVQDIHPDVITASGWRSLPRPLLNLWDRLNRWALARADRVLVLSEGMREVLAEKGITRDRVSVIPLWATPELTGDGAPAAAPEPAPDDPAPAPASAPHELTLFLGGNLGLTQQLDPLLEAMRLLRDEPVRLCITAEGVQADRWRQRADGIEAVSFLPFQSDAGYRAQVAGAGAAVVTLAPGLERLLVPSRAYPPMSAGVPLVAVMSADSEIGRLVIQHGAGVCSTDPGELAAAIRRWVHEPAARAAAGERAAQAYWQGGGRAALLARYVELIRG